MLKSIGKLKIVESNITKIFQFNITTYLYISHVYIKEYVTSMVTRGAGLISVLVLG